MSDNDPYAAVVKSKLKLKTSDSGISKKKKKKTNKEKIKQSTNNEKSQDNKNQSAPTPKTTIKMTNAEIAFQKMKEKNQKERISQKASMSHKQRVEKFNQHLDSLTEHFDIPKVSWTK